MAFLRRFLQAIKRARTQSRQKRIERLLALQDKESYSSKCNFYSSRVELCLSSPWCDLLDKGFVIVIMVILILLIAYFSLDEEEDRKARKFLLAIGIPIIVFRVVWRPLYWILWGRIQERRRKNTLELFDDLNSERHTKGMEIPADIVKV